MPKLIGLNEWSSVNADINQSYHPPKIIYDKHMSPMTSDPFSSISKLQDLRQASEAHRQVRRYVQSFIKPGMKILDICTKLENKMVEILGDTIESGKGFPTGFSINNCAAHDSAIPNDTRVLKNTDIVKIDIGTQKNGYIADSAFTIGFDPKFEPLINAAKDGMWAGIKLAGVDAPINDISTAIQEVIESFNLEIDGKIYDIRSSQVLCGHNLKQWHIHGGELIPGINTPGNTARMKDDTIYAIEVFPSNTDGMMRIDNTAPVSHYALRLDAPPPRKFNFKVSSQVYNYIKNKRATLPFCTRWVEAEIGKSYQVGLNELQKAGYLTAYPPIITNPSTYSAQFEHTIYINEKSKEILTYGDDY